MFRARQGWRAPPSAPETGPAKASDHRCFGVGAWPRGKNLAPFLGGIGQFLGWPKKLGFMAKGGSQLAYLLVDSTAGPFFFGGGVGGGVARRQKDRCSSLCDPTRLCQKGEPMLPTTSNDWRVEGLATTSQQEVGQARLVNVKKKEKKKARSRRATGCGFNHQSSRSLS